MQRNNHLESVSGAARPLSDSSGVSRGPKRFQMRGLVGRLGVISKASRNGGGIFGSGKMDEERRTG
eukprot:9503848-Pyramimonas_sp.AAC.1